MVFVLLPFHHSIVIYQRRQTIKKHFTCSESTLVLSLLDSNIAHRTSLTWLPPRRHVDRRRDAQALGWLHRLQRTPVTKLSIAVKGPIGRKPRLETKFSNIPWSTLQFQPGRSWCILYTTILILVQLCGSLLRRRVLVCTEEQLSAAFHRTDKL